MECVLLISEASRGAAAPTRNKSKYLFLGLLTEAGGLLFNRSVRDFLHGVWTPSPPPGKVFLPSAGPLHPHPPGACKSKVALGNKNDIVCFYPARRHVFVFNTEVCSCSTRRHAFLFNKKKYVLVQQEEMSSC